MKTAPVRYVSAEDVCPSCGGQWTYRHNGKQYTHLIGIYSRPHDRTVAWKCPHCGTEWDRGAVVEQSADAGGER
jgi:predicted RNA-binding Zn-ribbon protein involved in translation (DUF1610 family)